MNEELKRLKLIAIKISQYKINNGPQWKSKLKELFLNGTNRDEHLQQFRNKYLDLLPGIKKNFEYEDILEQLVIKSKEQ